MSPEHGPWSRAETEGAELAAAIAAENHVEWGGPDARYETELARAYHEDPEAFATWEPDWRCECRCLNHWHESFRFRCGAGKPEEVQS